METCEYFEELLSRSLDEALSPQEEEALSAHLARCGRCRELERQLKQLTLALRDWEDQPAPADLTRRVMDRVRSPARPARPRPFPWRSQARIWGSLAACAVLCAGLLCLSLPAAPAEHAAPIAVAAEGSSAADSQALPEGPAAPDVPLKRTAQSELCSPEPFLFSASPQQSGSDADTASAPDPLPDSGRLLQSVRDALETEPGTLLVLDALPDGIELEGEWLTTREGWSLTELAQSLPQQTRQSLADAAALLLSLGEGPTVLLLLG